MTQPRSQHPWMLVGCVLLGACAGTPRPRHEAPYRLDTVTNACRQSPAHCAALAGKETAGHTVAAAALTGQVVVRALEEPVRDLIDATLAGCADLARSEVLLRHRKDFTGQSPSKEECDQQVKDAAGRRVSRAMQLGTEMHQVARQCVEERLGQLRPGGFSLEPHYRYDFRSGQTQHIPEEDVAALRQSGNGGELLGTLVPDVVIHDGNPLHIQAVYDFKFPCFHLDDMPRWDAYPQGHPHHAFDQGRLYRTALRAPIARVAPRIGVQR
ncbi:hypothetical protein [Pyxidicoccus xibeiensis]|uniref:hypothetical protein n=1 Tax=Pyxidicoccus xibeiensis TaxID=2906759 RepID=UPI0020A7B2C3|nr:hypothetical protein [Pyxidicoccus xibeiensis]MCP3136049.1 hypothetical protein [Pyxidicoccus xibeiensis]